MQNFEESKVLFDTYAWIEYFRGSDEGKSARKYIESDIDILTPTIALAELSDKYTRSEKRKEWEENRRQIVELRSDIVTLSPDSADEAGEIKSKMRKEHGDFPLADGMILSIARENECRVLTGDKHMKDLEGAIDMKK